MRNILLGCEKGSKRYFAFTSHIINVEKWLELPDVGHNYGVQFQRFERREGGE
jgi:hypothetical protein